MKRLFLAIFVSCAFAVLGFAQASNDTLMVKGKYHTYLITKVGIYRPENRLKKILIFPPDREESRWYKVSGSGAPVGIEAKKFLKPYAKELGEIGVYYCADFKGNIYDVYYYFPNFQGCQYYVPFIDILDELAFSIMKNVHSITVTVTPEGEKHISAYEGIKLIPTFINLEKDED